MKLYHTCLYYEGSDPFTYIVAKTYHACNRALREAIDEEYKNTLNEADAEFVDDKLRHTPPMSEEADKIREWLSEPEQKEFDAFLGSTTEDVFYYGD